jgi:phosphoribosyl 1,2-cyclic phosphodiesterase
LVNEPGDFAVRFWGVRGSIACPGPAFVRYGGNTSCVEMRCGEHLLIFDGGTGLRPLGQYLKTQEPIDGDLFFTHSHLDHIVGLPFFASLFTPGNTFRMWAGHLNSGSSLKDVLCAMMVAPLFPVPIEIFTAQTAYLDFDAGDTLTPKPGVTLRTAALNHPNGATGYRVEYGGRRCAASPTLNIVGHADDSVRADPRRRSVHLRRDLHRRRISHPVSRYRPGRKVPPGRHAGVGAGAVPSRSRSRRRFHGPGGGGGGGGAA